MEIKIELDKKVKIILEDGRSMTGIFDEILGKYDWDTETDHYVFMNDYGIGYELEPSDIKEIEYL